MTCFSLIMLTAFLVAQSPDQMRTDSGKIHTAPAPSERFPATWYPPAGNGNDALPAPVIDHPFSATVGEVTPQANGGVPVTVVSGFLARDKMGRTRSDAESGSRSINGEIVKIITVEVSDPVSHCDFTWMEPVSSTVTASEMHLASVVCRAQSLRYIGQDFIGSIIQEEKDGTIVKEDVTTKIEHPPSVEVDGITVQRLRVTNTNFDQLGHGTVQTTETWYSPELKEVIRLGNDHDGFYGLIHIQRGDPSSDLFYPPSGYQIEKQSDKQ